MEYLIRAARANALLVTIGSLAAPHFDLLRVNSRYGELLKALNLQHEPIATLHIPPTRSPSTAKPPTP